MNVNRPAAAKFGVPESTVRSIVKAYNKEKSDKYEEPAKLPKRPRGAKPLLPGEIDAKVVSMIKSMLASGHSITYDITISIAKGLVKAHDRTLLNEHGGLIDLNQTWAQSIHRRLGFLKRKTTTSKQAVSPGFIHEASFTFYSDIQRNINAYLIPPELIINIDQAPLRFYLTPTRTLTKKGEASVPIANSSDYRQITLTFGISMAEEFLPIQLIYQGKTNKCHSNYNFPNGFHITHTLNHWSNEIKSLEMIDKIIMPYFKQQIADLQLRKNQEWLLIADAFKGQWTEAVKKRIAELHGKMVPVPNNMTHVFQPLDLTVNRSCKAPSERAPISG